MSAKDQIKQLVDYFKREPYLKDKTDAMGDGLMLGASLADEANERSKEATATTKAIQDKYKEQILAQDLNPNKDPELVDLRGGKATAGERITEFEQETTAQFQQTDAQLAEIVQDESIIVTVGANGNYSTINEALSFLSRKTLKYDIGLKAEIKLLSGYIMKEQVYVESIDLSFITITSADEIVEIDPKNMTNMITIPGYAGGMNLNANACFIGIWGAKLPIIDVLFKMLQTSTSNISGLAVIHGSEATIKHKKGFVDCLGTSISATEGSRIYASNANASGAGKISGNGINVFRGSYVLSRGVNASNAGDYGVYLDNSSMIDASHGDFSNAGRDAIWASGQSMVSANASNCSGAGGNAISTDNASVVDAHGSNLDNPGNLAVECNASQVIIKDSTAKNAGGLVIRCRFGGTVDADSVNMEGYAGIYAIASMYGSKVNARNAKCQKVVGTDANEFYIISGSEINANGATGGIYSVQANTLTNEGIIYKNVVVVPQALVLSTDGWSGTLYYDKDNTGKVWMRGVLTVGTSTPPKTIGVIYAGYRPLISELSISALNANTTKIVNAFKLSLSGGLQVLETIPTGNVLHVNYVYQSTK